MNRSETPRGLAKTNAELSNANGNSPPCVDEAIATLRRQLRRAIASRLCWQLLAGLVAFAFTFLVVDRLFEPSVGVRIALLTLAGAPAVAWLALIAGPRLLRGISDREVLGLAAYQAPREADLIRTAIDVGKSRGAPHALSEAMHAAASAAALVVGRLRLVRSAASMTVVPFAAVGLTGLLALAAARPDLAACFANRLALDDAPWPRRVRLVAPGFDYNASEREWRRVAARGEPAELLVSAVVDPGLTPPSTLWARGFGGSTNLTTLTRLATQSDDDASVRRFRKRIASLDSDVAGVLRCGDARLRFRLIALERPRLTDIRVTVTPPAYLKRPPALATVGALRPAPEGSRLTLAAGASRRIESATARDEATRRTRLATVGSSGLLASFDLGVLAETSRFVLTMTDTDGLGSEPVVLDVECAGDTPPTVSLGSTGIGRAITRDAVLPLNLRLDDDHGVSDVTVQIAGGDHTVLHDVAIPSATPASVETTVDLLSLRTAGEDRSIAVEPGDELLVTALARDAYDLGPREPSRSIPIRLGVVSPTELLALLADAQRELRSTLESVRVDAERLVYELDLQRRRLADADPEAIGRTARWGGERLLDARKLADGVVAVATRAENLGDQAANNRLEQPALVERLTLRVATPMRRLLDREFAIADRRLSAVTESPTDEPAAAIGVAHAAAQRVVETLTQASAALESQDTYNEVVAMLRALVRDQRRVNERTTAASKASARRLLLD